MLKYGTCLIYFLGTGLAAFVGGGEVIYLWGAVEAHLRKIHNRFVPKHAFEESVVRLH